MKSLQYQLQGLDCANCAAKIERKISKVPGIIEANVNFANTKMYLEVENEQLNEIKAKIVSLVHEIEADVVCVEVHKEDKVEGHEKPEEGSHHDHCDCDQHDHDHDDYECGCSHLEVEKAEQILEQAMKFHILGLDCASCAQKVEDAILKQDNIADASLNFSTSMLFVKMNKKEDEKSLLHRLQTVIDSVEDGVTIVNKEEGKSEKNKTLRNEKIRLFFAISVFIIATIYEQESFAIWFYLLAFVIAGGNVIYTALRNILKGQVFDENFLMSIATIGAFMIGSYEEGVEVMIFYEIGELFQSYAVNRSRKSISSLMDIRADFANKIVEGKEIRVNPEEIKVGDIIQIRPGERVALDGIIMQGDSSLDTSPLTGESLPRDVQVDDEVLAGSVNLSGLIQLRVSKEFKESTVSRILELVENAGSKKAPMEKFITKFARIYTPIVVCLAILVLVIPMVFIPGAIVDEWLYRALTFLVVSCPCALVVSIPLGLFAGIGGASKKGILIKGGNYLEALNDIDTVVFDKTGTLTKGSFHVDEVHSVVGLDDVLLEIGAYGEFYSNHPIARSIVKQYGKEIEKSRIQDFVEIAGNGVSVNIDGIVTVLGNTKLMNANQIDYDKQTPIGTSIHIAQNNKYLGYIVINDEIKEYSAQAIIDLKAQGVKQCIMLSGDRNEVAQIVGDKLKLDKVYAQLLPVDKVERVEALLAQKGIGKLAFVGDGINDAPVLARADIGVAMGGIGSDAAIEAADIVLMKDDPRALAEAMKISKKTKKILWQNIVFSIAIKVIVLVLTIFGASTMKMGVFADVGVTLLAILNSMRALRA